MAKKILLILILSTKMYGCARFLTEQWEQENRRESEPRSGRMDWWAPQSEYAHLRKHESSQSEKASVAASDSLDQSTMNKLLHITVAAGKLQAVQYLIKKGASINGRDEDGWTPLMKATKGKHLAVVKELLDAGADMDAYSDYCRVCAAARDGDYPPSWCGPREYVTPPPHKCRQVTTAPYIAKFAYNAELVNLFEEYKNRNNKSVGTNSQSLATDSVRRPISYRTPLP